MQTHREAFAPQTYRHTNIRSQTIHADIYKRDSLRYIDIMHIYIHNNMHTDEYPHNHATKHRCTLASIP